MTSKEKKEAYILEIKNFIQIMNEFSKLNNTAYELRPKLGGDKKLGSLRTSLNRKIPIIKNYLKEIELNKIITISPPPIMGGAIYNGCPFDIMFSAPYGLDQGTVFQAINDILEQAIGILESNREEIKNKDGENMGIINKKVFIVHGHDDVLKLEVARVIEKLKLKAIILHEQANGGGATIIEKLEEHTDVGYGIILYTPCDIGGKNLKDLNDLKDLKTRARQNVVFEHGLLIGKLGRNRVMTIKKDEVELPGDISGTVYTSANEGWKHSLVGELKKSGYSVDANDLY